MRPVMSAPIDTLKPSLLDLPPEIRLMIYDYIYHGPTRPAKRSGIEFYWEHQAIRELSYSGLLFEARECHLELAHSPRRLPISLACRLLFQETIDRHLTYHVIVHGEGPTLALPPAVFGLAKDSLGGVENELFFLSLLEHLKLFQCFTEASVIHIRIANWPTRQRAGLVSPREARRRALDLINDKMQTLVSMVGLANRMGFENALHSSRGFFLQHLRPQHFEMFRYHWEVVGTEWCLVATKKPDVSQERLSKIVTRAPKIERTFSGAVLPDQKHVVRSR